MNFYTQASNLQPPDYGLQTTDYRLRTILAAALVALAGFLAFSPSLGADFVFWDDDLSIYDNELVSRLDADHLRRFFSLRTALVDKYSPLYWLSLAANRALFGPGPFSFHLVNLLFHAASGALLFLILLALLRAAFPGERDRAAPAALFGALLWAVHPLRVNAVALAANRSYCQAVFFLLASFYLHLSASLGRRDGCTLLSRPGYWAAVLLFAASLFTFPIGLGALAAFLALDVWLSGTWRLPARILTEKLPLAAVTALSLAANLVLRSGAIGPEGGALSPGQALREAACVFSVWGFPLGKTLLPVGLTPYPALFLNPAPPAWPFALSVLAVAGVSVLAFLARKRFPGLLLIWLVYLSLLVPVLFESFPSERYAYLPALALSTAAAAGFLLLARRTRHPAVLPAAAALCLLALAAASVRHTAIWRDSPSLFGHILSHEKDRPFHAPIHARLGMWLMIQGDLPGSLRNLDQALALDPTAPDPRFVRGVARVRSGNPGSGEEDLLQASLLAGKSPHLSRVLPQGYTQAGNAYFDRKLYEDALRWYEKGAALLSPDPDGLVRMGVCHAYLGRVPRAVEFFEKAVDMAPGNLLAQYNLGYASRFLGRTGQARAHLEKALAINPGFAPARAALAELPPPPLPAARDQESSLPARELYLR